jgi:hypothetical protein
LFLFIVVIVIINRTMTIDDLAKLRVRALSAVKWGYDGSERAYLNSSLRLVASPCFPLLFSFAFTILRSSLVITGA